MGISIIAWIMPIFRQYKGSYFYYFLFVGLTDSVAVLILYLFNFQPNYHLSLMSTLAFFSLRFPRSEKIRFKALDYILALLLLVLFFAFKSLIHYMIVVHILIVLQLSEKIMINLFNQNVLKIFLVVLLFYELTITVNLIVISVGYSGIIIYYFTLFLQVFLAVFFTIFLESHPKLNIKLKASAL